MTEIRSRFHVLSIHDDDTTRIVMGDDDRQVPMPKAPTLADFFKLRFSGTEHLLQSANLAMMSHQNEKVITACLLHDIAVCGFIRGDHGYYGEQMIAPYVDEEVAWAVKVHQALRFFPDKSVGYKYPKAYVNWFGEDYKVDEYIEHEYKAALNNPWYMTARMVTVNDLYSFEPTTKVKLEDFTDIIGRNFKQPKEGLGFDNSPCAHIWRSIIRPNKFL